jgi:hypothetical protein
VTTATEVKPDAEMSQLKIVWRNPKTARRQRRWHELACDVGRKLYVVEELVPQGDQKRGRRPRRWKWSMADEQLLDSSFFAICAR